MVEQFVQGALELGLQPLGQFGAACTVGRGRRALAFLRQDVAAEGDVHVRAPRTPMRVATVWIWACRIVCTTVPRAGRCWRSFAAGRVS